MSPGGTSLSRSPWREVRSHLGGEWVRRVRQECFFLIYVFFLSTISKEGECSREGFGSPLEALLTAFYTDLALRFSKLMF